ncbi:MAG: hypothetical protein ACR2P1_29595 [Pseudomonadales bacterium]
MKRRRFVQSTLAAGLITSPVGKVLAEQKTLVKTPQDFEGPYYPRGSRHKTNDLIRAKPRSKVLYFRGNVANIRGEPSPGALVDIWQTDRLGRYNHPRDSSPGARWDDFLYWGEATTDQKGDFQFRTYVPGAYAPRPAHIHYKVWSNRQLLLTSQIYFAELGGTKGQSKLPRFGDLQTARLVEIGDGALETNFQVVV